jgi:hypothetical protein
MPHQPQLASPATPPTQPAFTSTQQPSPTSPITPTRPRTRSTAAHDNVGAWIHRDTTCSVQVGSASAPTLQELSTTQAVREDRASSYVAYRLWFTSLLRFLALLLQSGQGFLQVSVGVVSGWLDPSCNRQGPWWSARQKERGIEARLLAHTISNTFTTLQHLQHHLIIGKELQDGLGLVKAWQSYNMLVASVWFRWMVFPASVQLELNNNCTSSSSFIFFMLACDLT